MGFAFLYFLSGDDGWGSVGRLVSVIETAGNIARTK